MRKLFAILLCLYSGLFVFPDYVAEAQTSFLVAENGSQGNLNADINASTTTVVLQAGHGANFPSTFNYHVVVDNEIMKVTARTSDTLTVVRAQEGTSASSHLTGALVSLNVTAEYITELQTAINALETATSLDLPDIGVSPIGLILFGDSDDMQMGYDGINNILQLGDGTQDLFQWFDLGTTGHFHSTGPITVADSDTSIQITGASIDVGMGVHDENGLTSVEYAAHKHNDSSFGSVFYGAKSRGNEASETIVQSGDALLSLIALGYDGVDYNPAASISFDVNGTPGANDMPGRIEFNTSPDGSNTLTERMQIDESQILATVPFVAPAATTSIPSVQIPEGVAPSSLSNGYVWMESDGLHVYAGGIEIGPLIDSSSAGATSEAELESNIGANVFTDQDTQFGPSTDTDLIQIGANKFEIRTPAGLEFNLATSDTAVIANDVLGTINFYAPIESDGAVSIADAARIQVVAAGTFNASNNLADILFMLGGTSGPVEALRMDNAGSSGDFDWIYANDMDINPDTDFTSRIGRMQIDSRGTDIFHLSHVDMSNVTEFAVKQDSSGNTTMNAATASSLIAAIGGGARVTIDATDINAHYPVIIDTTTSTPQLHIDSSQHAIARIDSGGSAYTSAIDIYYAGNSQWRAGMNGSRDWTLYNNSTAAEVINVDFTNDDVEITGEVHTLGNEYQYPLDGALQQSNALFDVVADVQTTDATATAIGLVSTSADFGYTIEATYVGIKNDGSQIGSYKEIYSYQNDGGSLAEQNETNIYTSEDDAAWDVDATMSGTNILLRVTGNTGDTVEWTCSYKVTRVDGSP